MKYPKGHSDDIRRAREGLEKTLRNLQANCQHENVQRLHILYAPDERTAFDEQIADLVRAYGRACHRSVSATEMNNAFDAVVTAIQARATAPQATVKGGERESFEPPMRLPGETFGEWVKRAYEGETRAAVPQATVKGDAPFANCSLRTEIALVCSDCGRRLS